jgi:hypothetical protein
MRIAVLIATAAVLLAACSERPLRGSADPSADGKTYLAIVDDNGGGCGPVKVDGQVWSHRVGEMAPIEPGKHTIECGGSIAFEIPHGVVFRFDYWGP